MRADHDAVGDGRLPYDLKRNILGNNAHIVIDRENAHIEGWQPMLEPVDARFA